MTRVFNVPQTIITGGGASGEAGVQAVKLKAKKVLLVTDSYMVDCGSVAKITDNIKSQGVEVEIFPGVQPDPTDLNVLEGLNVFNKKNCDLIVGLGGGSP
ncbi:MAG: iron-containing alcohol dehydrogenase, partial [Deltaproteobacteria bacterium]|nr:iron-containing alcohol dehydrogenase [Deltaproteobacteria bacterium]